MSGEDVTHAADEDRHEDIPAYGFTEETIRPEGEQEKSSSRPKDCNKPHKG